MAKLFPFRPEPDVRSDPQLVNIDDDAADDVFAALSSDTARAILRALYVEPATASDLADAVETSLQNARYHLDNLMDAGLVEAVDTWYSSRGTEMTVYAPTSDPLIVTAGREERTTVLKQALSRIVGAIGVLGLASLLIDRFAPGPATQPGPTAGDGEFGVLRNASTASPSPEQESQNGGDAGVMGGGGDGPPATNVTEAPSLTAEAEPTPTLTPTGMEADSGLIDTLVTTPPPPGVVFFAGGLLVLLLAASWWYWFHYRPIYT